MLRSVLVAFVLAAGVSTARAQSNPPPAGTLEVAVSSQGGSVVLPGVLVLLRGAAGEDAGEQVTDADGRVAFTGLASGTYRINATLDGFDPIDRSITMPTATGASITLDMTIASVSERVDVVAASPVVERGTLSSSETISNTQAQWLAPGTGVQGSLRLLPNIVPTRSGDSINGARPSQAGYQIGAASLVDPGDNIGRASLPADGVDSVTVLANPYETEYGRFTSGLVSVETRRAIDSWRFGVNNTIPAFRTKRFTIANIEGLGAVKPSLEAGGPLVKGRVFVEETAQYSWFSTDVPSRPESELKTTQWFGSMTRVDANMSARHALAITGGFDDSDATHATLGTFTPPSATANIADRLGYAVVSERSLVRAATFVETTVAVHAYDTRVAGQGAGAMELLPETTNGDFFNRQRRQTSSAQWVETLSTSRAWYGGQHLLKIGSDLLANTYDGTSASAPVIVARSDRTVARRLDFAGPSVQDVRSVDYGAFAQDRIQPSRRWYVEVGARVDRDGIAEDVSVSPRAGAAVVLNGAATAVVRGGYGLFYERTPSVAGAFGAFEAAADSRFAADGVTPAAAPLRVVRVVGDLRAAHSAMWNLSYDHRLSPRWAIHASLLDRHGDGELIVDPERDEVSERLVLSSGGRSHYLQQEVGVHLTRGTRMDVNASYVHASAREHLNAFLNFYDSVLQPIVSRDEYAAAAADVPHRVFVRGQAMPTGSWSLVGTFDWRTGLPYSVVNEELDFVGERNVQRFPNYVRTEIGIDRRVHIARSHPWIGARAANALAAFLPADVQANLGSPAFGSFYNSEYRQFRIHVRFER